MKRHQKLPAASPTYPPLPPPSAWLELVADLLFLIIPLHTHHTDAEFSHHQVVLVAAAFEALIPAAPLLLPLLLPLAGLLEVQMPEY